MGGGRSCVQAASLLSGLWQAGRRHAGSLVSHDRRWSGHQVTARPRSLPWAGVGSLEATATGRRRHGDPDRPRLEAADRCLTTEGESTNAPLHTDGLWEFSLFFVPSTTPSSSHQRVKGPCTHFTNQGLHRISGGRVGRQTQDYFFFKKSILFLICLIGRFFFNTFIYNNLEQVINLWLSIGHVRKSSF